MKSIKCFVFFLGRLFADFAYNLWRNGKAKRITQRHEWVAEHEDRKTITLKCKICGKMYVSKKHLGGKI